MKNKKTIIITISTIAIILASLASYNFFTASKDNDLAENDPSKIIISTYEGGEVNLKEVEIELNKLILQNDKLRGITFDQLTKDQKEVLIKEAVLKQIFSKEAKKRNLNKSKEYKEALLLIEVELLKQQLFADIAKKSGSKENVQKEYDRLVAELVGKKDIRISYISVKTKKEAKSLYTYLVKRPKYFADQAKKKSLDKESAKKGGDLGFVLKDNLQTEITDQINNLKKGEVSKPISLNDKWVLIKLEDERDAQVAKFEDVKDTLSQSLAEKALQKFIASSLKEAKISIPLQ
jgi:peptidyl-prolyl cis-trans isomerase C